MRAITPFRFLILASVTLALAGCGGGSKKADLSAARTNTISVNSYLWKAALETVDFMPLLQADANSGVIISDWYANPVTPNERVKVTVTILDRDMRADGLRVAVQRQEARAGVWTDAAVKSGTVEKMEDAILQRARRNRQASVGN
jgi:Domain of unknown function (DUF3576)